jgi:hypothetical protein
MILAFEQLAFVAYSSVAQVQNDSAKAILLPATFRENRSELVWVVLLVAFATAGLVQTLKELTGWRHNFHRSTVRGWVSARVRDVPARIVKALHPSLESMTAETSPSRPQEAIRQLERLSGGDALDDEGRDALAAYSLSAEELGGQLASAAEVTVAAPDRFAELFGAFAGSLSSIPADDFARYIELCQARQKVSNNSNIRESSQWRADEERYAELRAQFMIHAQRSLDNLQIRIGQSWRRRLTTASIAFSFIFGVVVMLVVFASRATSPGPWEWVVTIFVVTIAGALLAPTAHDLTSAIRSHGR